MLVLGLVLLLGLAGYLSVAARASPGPGVEMSKACVPSAAALQICRCCERFMP